MSDSILQLIAQPQTGATDVTKAVQAAQARGEQSELNALQQQLVGSQFAGQEAANVEAAGVSGRAADLRQGIAGGGPQFGTSFKLAAMDDPAGAQKLFEVFKGADVASLQQAGADLQLAARLTGEPRQQALKKVQAGLNGTLASDMVGRLAAMPEGPEKDKEMIKTAMLVNNMRGALDDPAVQQALNVGSTVGLSGGGVGRVVTDPLTGATRVEQAALPEGTRIESAEERSDIRIREAGKKEDAKKLSSERAETRSQILTSGRDADRGKVTLERIQQGLELVATGKMAEAKRILGPFIPGLDPSNEQAMTALLQTAVFPVLANFKGPTTDFEFAKAQETIARLGNTPQANKMIVGSMLRVLQDKIDERDQFQTFTKGGGEVEAFQFTPGGAKQPFGEQQGLGMPTSMAEGTRAVSPQTGVRIIVRNGKWEAQ